MGWRTTQGFTVRMWWYVLQCVRKTPCFTMFDIVSYSAEKRIYVFQCITLCFTVRLCGPHGLQWMLLCVLQCGCKDPLVYSAWLCVLLCRWGPLGLQCMTLCFTCGCEDPLVYSAWLCVLQCRCEDPLVYSAWLSVLHCGWEDRMAYSVRLSVLQWGC